MNKEYRTIHGIVEKRESEDGFDFRGLASRTGNEYTLLESDAEVWTEVIDVNAFNDVLNNDVRVLFNHDESKILGRTKSGSAKVWVDITGLHYAWKTPDTTLGKDLAASIERGDIDQSSFGFRVKPKDNIWERTILEDGRKKVKRTILKVSELFDVSPVTYPANPDTYAGRSVEEAFKEYLCSSEDEGIGQMGEDDTNCRQLSVDFATKLTQLNERIIN